MIKYLFVISVLSAGCIKEAHLNYRTPNPTLVVNGLLLTDSTPCSVTLSYSGLFLQSGVQIENFINDAIVYLHDDIGDSTLLSNSGKGKYIDESLLMHAQVNHSYYITIALSNGEKYASLPEKILPVVKKIELDTISTAIPHGLPDLYGADIRIKTNDPPGEVNYYRWISLDYVSRKAFGIPCGSPYNNCYAYCYQLYPDDSVRILSDADIDGGEIRRQNVLISPYFYYGLHFIEIKQLSITREAYQFWSLFLEQANRSGSILDPLPASLEGNIYNVNDSSSFALGYFEASDVASLKLTIAPHFLNAYYTLAYIARYVYPYEGKCWEVYEDAYENTPPGWEGLPYLFYDVY